jgi:hypothetical protein
MPTRQTIEKSRRAARQGKAPTTQAGEFVREEIDHVRGGKHGARNTKQTIAIGLSKARRAGVPLPPPRKGTASEQTRRKAKQDDAIGSSKAKPKPSPKRSRATLGALKREGKAAASSAALSRQAKSAAARRKRRGPTTSTQRRDRRSSRA